MPKVMRPQSTRVVVTPKDGELEITLNINISVDGIVTATSESASVTVKEEDDKVSPMIPDFFGGLKLDFGK